MTPSKSGESELLGAAIALLVMLEANYTYETVNVKRWIAEADSCEICIDNEDMGWVDDDAVFEGVFGDVDGPEAHPHCLCSLEYGEKRRRVYD